MEKIKIAFCWSLPLCNIYGGGEKVLSELLSVINLDEFDVTLVIEHPKIHAQYYSLIKDKVKIVSIYNYKVGYYKKITISNGTSSYRWKYFPPSGVVREISKILILKRFLKLFASNYDVIVDHDPFHFLKYISKYKIKPKAKVIGWHHTDYARFKDCCERLKRGMKNPLSLMDGLFFVSDVIKNQSLGYVRSINSNLSKHLYYTPNGINFDHICKLANNVDSLMNDFEKNLIKSDYVLCTARVQYSKGQDIAIEAFSIICDRFPHLNLIFIGGLGENSEIFVNQVKQYKLQDRIFFLGVKENPYIWMKNCKLSILCSRYEESFGLVVLESMFFNKSVILPKLPQLLDIYKGFVNYFSVGDSLALSDVMANVLTINTEIIDENRYDTFLQRYSLNTSSQIFANGIKNILNK